MQSSVIDFEEKRIVKLPARELSRHLMRMPVKRRLNVILDRNDGEEIVIEMSAQDFFMTVQELGAEDAMALLSLATMEQVNHIFDLQCWKRDEISAARALEWLERLGRAGRGKLLAWLYQADFELIVSLFKSWIRVEVAPEEMDQMEAVESMPKNTLDDTYYWETFYPQYEDFIRGVLILLFEASSGYYQELLSSVMNLPPALIEEDAYRFHRGRLEDHAIPDFFDAINIYNPMRVEDIPRGKIMRHPEEGEPDAPSFALAMVREEDLIFRALQLLDDPEELNGIQLELASIANKIVVADEVPVDDVESLRTAVHKAISGVNLGLELLSGGNEQIALKVLTDVYLENLFRAGYGQVSRLGKLMQRVQREGWIARWPAGIRIIDQEWSDAVELLLRRTPRLLHRDSRGTPVEKMFSTPQDLSEGKRLVDMVLCVGELLESMDINPEALAARLWSEGQVATLADVTAGTLIWTVAARELWTGDTKVELIPVSAWRGVFHAISDPEKLNQKVLDLVRRIVSNETKQRLIEAYLSPILSAYAAELSQFSRGIIPEAQLVRFLMFTDSE